MPTNLFTRRSFFLLILISLGFGLRKLFFPKATARFKGKIMGANSVIGHMMRLGKFPPATKFEEVETVIVGGGISGLSAGWWLNKNGHKNFLILELDQAAGGNSLSGKNEVSAYPWAAHYVPMPGREAEYVREFFEEIGVITGYRADLPIYNEFYLCSDPHERIFFQGKWHRGFLPESGLTVEERKHNDEFSSFMQQISNVRGQDGKRAMTIPLELSSQDQQFRKLDKISMSDFLDQKGWTSNYLRWYVNYCCRDDYGLMSHEVSAWSGIHYFASRSGKAINAGKETVLTWPEGNGFLVRKMAEKFPELIRKNALAHQVEKSGEQFLVTYYDVIQKTSHVVKAKNVIYSAPRFTAKYVLDPSVGNFHNNPKLSHVPWMVANVTVDRKPEGPGEDLSWDNVSFYSKSLGYIVATHQDLKTLKQKTVLTYYLPLNDHAPMIERRLALEKDHAHWANLVAEDLEKMHPGLTETILNIDIWLWGHGMVGPGIDFLWSEERQKMLESLGNLHFAHSDMSGISIFEEAQYRGVMAAKKVLQVRS